MARNGTALERWPAELGSGSGMICWRKIRDWQMAGFKGSNRLIQGGGRQLFRKGTFCGAKIRPNSTDLEKNEPKRHLISNGRGIPLAVIHTGANVHDSQQTIPLVDAITAIKCPRGGKRRRPDALNAAKAYDLEAKIRKPSGNYESFPRYQSDMQNKAVLWKNIVLSSNVSWPSSSSIGD